MKPILWEKKGREGKGTSPSLTGGGGKEKKRKSTLRGKEKERAMNGYIGAASPST